MAAKELSIDLMKATRSSNHSDEIANTLTNYLINNIKVPITYVGVIPGTPPVPDPIVADILSVVGKIPKLDNSSFDSWVSSIESGIMNFELSDPGIVGIKPNSPLKIFKEGLELKQEDLKKVFDEYSGPIYKWSEVTDSDDITDQNKVIEIYNLSDLSVDEYISDFVKIKAIDDKGEEFYKYFKSTYIPYNLVWDYISEQIISWLTDPKLHLTSFPAQGTASGSKGTATVTPIVIT